MNRFAYCYNSCLLPRLFNTAFHFCGTSATATQVWAPLPHCGGAAHPALFPSHAEKDLGGLVKTAAGKSWPWCHVCPVWRETWGRRQSWATCSVFEALQVCCKCVCICSTSVTAPAMIVTWSKWPDEARLLFLNLCSDRRCGFFPQTLLPPMYLFTQLLFYL